MTRTTSAAPLAWLYVPGDRPDRFDKAVASGASVVVVDLEDAVAPPHKSAARRNVRDFLAAGVDGAEVHVRVNDAASEWAVDDLGALADLGDRGPGAVRVPKVESAQGLDAVAARLGDRLPLFALVETARGLESLREIAHHPAVTGLALGEQDLRTEVGLSHPSALDHLRVLAVLAAAAADVGPVPAPAWTDLADERGFVADTRRLRGLGMFGRTCLHPRQVPLVAEAFAPTAEELAWARDVVAVADATGGAAVTPDGQFVDGPVAARARKLLELGRSLSRAPAR